MVNMSSSNNSTPRSTSHQSSPTGSTVPATRSTIDEFREIIREQSFVLPSSSSADQVLVKRYPPLPDITAPNSSSSATTFFRTETVLTASKANPPKKQMFYHFAPTQRAHLPALNKRHILPTMVNVMDLDEDLPQYHSNIMQRPSTYTSPGDRVISPITRPSAPSPPASAHVKRAGQNAFIYGGEDQDEEDDENFSGLDDDDDDDDSHSLDEESYRYNRQPTTMMNRRLEDYDQEKPYININGGQSSISVAADHGGRGHLLNPTHCEPLS